VGAQILIVEDNEANCELMRYLLQAFGHTVVAARDGAGGLASAQMLRPDLILCDIQMPGIDGMHLARRIRQIPALTGIVLLAVTALAMVGDREVIMAAGFDGYLSKPVAPETFVQQVQAFLPAALHGSRSDTRRTTPVSPQPPRYRGTILVVDDRPENLQLARSLFGRSGYLVRTGSGVRAALDDLSRILPDVILSDVVMSDGSGYDLIRRVKSDQRLGRIAFVFVTSTLTAESERRRGLALGAARFIFRPIEPQELLAAVNGCLRERL